MQTKYRVKKYRERLYNDGYKQIQLWVKRDITKKNNIDNKTFNKKLKEITLQLDNKKMSQFYCFLLEIAEQEVKKKKYK